MKKIAFILICLFIVIACGKDPVAVNITNPSEYYPLKIGAWYIYDVDSISYNDFTNPVTIDSIQYQVKEEITDTFRDQVGNLNFELRRFKRFSNDSVPVTQKPWQISDVWFVTQKGENIERVEENLRYVSLLNPVNATIEWDGNAFNSLESWDFTYTNINQSFNNFEETVTVVQRNLENPINLYDFKEVFAKNVGLIYRVRRFVESQDNDQTAPVLDGPTAGYQFFQTLVQYSIPE